MRIATFCLLILLSGQPLADPIRVGDTALDIPSPAGFTAVSAQMDPLYGLLQRFVAPTNVEFAGFISNEDAALALNNEIPELSRRFTVQTAKTLEKLQVSSTEFAELKRIIKTQNNDIVAQTRAAIDESIGKINADINEQYDVDLALSVSQVVPLPVHEESERILSYSAYVKLSINDEAGNPVPIVTGMTVTFVHVRAKVLFLYSYAEESGLEWSKAASSKWSQAVVNANPSNIQTSFDENLPAAIAGIDWRQVGIATLTGAFLGLVIGLVGWLVKRRKSS